jgi:hypothetical protein
VDIKKEDFPLYQLLVELNQPGIEKVKAAFEAAQTGGDEEKYYFALGIQTVAANVPAGVIPGCTKEINEKTLQSCFRVFEDLASRGHANAALVAENFKSRGLGQPPKPAPSRPPKKFSL